MFFLWFDPCLEETFRKKGFFSVTDAVLDEVIIYNYT